MTSARNLKILAGVVWYAGAVAMSLKGSRLLIEASALNPAGTWPWLAIVSGLLLGVIQGRLLFVKSCKRNLERIDCLTNPRIWQFFRPGFFLALLAMILTGASLSRLAHSHYPFLVAVAALDFGIASALLFSSYVFWTRN